MNARRELLCLAFFISSGFSAEFIFAKTPNSPFYKYEHWAHNVGGILDIKGVASGHQPKKFKTTAGVDLNLEPAWDISTGSKSVIVAIIDDGFDYNHPDLKDNLWVSPEGTPGYNFADRNSDPHPYVWDVDRSGAGRVTSDIHGTLALGIIGAKGNTGHGVAGINWDISMMLLRVENQQGVGGVRKDASKNIAEAIRYAVDHGAKIINWSGFVSKITETEKTLIRESIHYAEKRDVLITIAAGNGAIDIDVQREKLTFPQSEDFENVVFVANVDPQGHLPDYSNLANKQGNHLTGGSNWGKARAFIAAPAESGLTTYIGDNGEHDYILGGGTSDAAPMVAGVAALMLSVNPKLGYQEIKDILCKTAKPLASLKGKLQCEGIPNAARAVALAKNFAITK